MQALKKLTILLGLSSKFRPQTFTYFIPAPKQSKIGYREKNFDRITHELMSKGFEVIDIKTQAITHQNIAGLWIIIVLRPLNQAAAKLDLENFQPESIAKSAQDQTEYLKPPKHIKDQESAEIIELEMDPDIDDHQLETTLDERK